MALAADDLQNRALIEPLGLRKNGSGDFDFIIEGKHSADAERRFGVRCKPLCQQYAHGRFDFARELDYDIVEQADFIVRVLV
ncbi:MAG TPA: hypothetical protein VMJ52_14815 [Xanthobacteraceae bacterium]|nr:hypothetical protein [Xanthobacteraceae bacterium]